MPHMVRFRCLVLIVIAGLFLVCEPVFAGNLDAPAAPTAAGSAMFTIEDLYNRLNAGTAGTKRSGAFVEPAAGPGATMHSLDDLMNKAPAVDGAGAAPADVLTGKTYWGLTSGQWGPRAGSMANVGSQSFIPGIATQTISQGYHDGNGKVAGDPNLVTGNIKAGSTIFGISGSANVVDTSTGDATADDLMAGKKAFVAGAQVTGALQTRTLSNATTTVTAGNYAGTTLDTVDTDLVGANIRSGSTIFGVVGNSAVVNTASANATAGEILFNRTAWVNGQPVTGTRLGGVILKAGGSFSPGGRWYDNADGTITDVTTGLVWKKTLSIDDRALTATITTQIDIIRYCGELQNGYLGLTDGSRLNDWRPPTIREMQSLMTGTEAIGGGNFQGFSGTASYSYWTISQDTVDPACAITINMNTGVLTGQQKVTWGVNSIRGFIWPVRNALIP